MNVKFSAKVRNICEMKCIFAPRFVPTWGFILHFGLKGNRVRVPDSPAAVTFSRGLLNIVKAGIKPAPTEMPLLKKDGKASNWRKSEDLQDNIHLAPPRRGM